MGNKKRQMKWKEKKKKEGEEKVDEIRAKEGGKIRKRGERRK